MKDTGIFGWIRMPKWVVFWFSIIATIAFVASSLPQLSGLCSRWEPNCQLPHLYFAEAIFWAPVLLIMSLITYPLNKRIFDSWSSFVLPWVILSTVIVFFAPAKQEMYATDWKAIASLSLTAISFIASLLIIIVKSVQVYWRT